MNTIEFLLVASLLLNAFIGIALLAVAVVLKVAFKDEFWEDGDEVSK